ncbi:MAG: hypothetical protein LHW64_03695 [Candidatus Cloacimonetes bacterium]|jgi:hypothetical protein|nr:hypothetical protein [Candidatus Cloacimonadota bacterium]MCB5286888.1 hypothetical protein [Candidatus Cloacimonadota bacterium]MCK9185152.1 hypothetical protein [Candidatus Cloacimonadota bacterium]MCK9584712.1 hypothetical protein [Candidatus Cloacimonadota bacterium]MDY0229209.1 hypothetical protein [Candidatus Cloacimonadaceae bacterium]
MKDLNQDLEERWRQRRKKAYNWPKLLVMIALLVALIYGMGMLQSLGKSSAQPSAEVQDSTIVQSPEQEP